MKRMILVLAVVASACSTQQEQSSDVKGVPGSPVLMPPLVLGCIETQTFVDAPGFEHELSIRQRLQTASVQRRSISDVAQGEWEIDALSYSVEEKFEDDGTMHLWLEQNVDKNVDWKNEGSCFKLVAQESYRLTRDAEGTWKGEAQLIGNILVNPEVKDCSFPHIARPMPRELACSQK